ncbi:hypothetical protein FOM00_25215 [Pseudomonas sp. ST1]|nr:hypothetical protein DXU85_25285 [Pseudomonas savastanoi]TSC33283.1 hypothetical protein FOM00_25215 [Pseudomonas sp. ST1]
MSVRTQAIVRRSASHAVLDALRPLYDFLAGAQGTIGIRKNTSRAPRRTGTTVRWFRRGSG